MKRFKTVNTEAPQKTTLLRICCIYMYNSNVCTMYVRSAYVFVCFYFYRNKLYVYKLSTPNIHTHRKYSVLYFMPASPTNQPDDRIVCESACVNCRAGVANNLDEKISQVGIFSLMGNLYYLFSRIFGIWWAHITGNHHMSLENADKAKMCVRLWDACYFQTHAYTLMHACNICKSPHSHSNKTHFANPCERVLHVISWISMIHIQSQSSFTCNNSYSVEWQNLRPILDETIFLT